MVMVGVINTLSHDIILSFQNTQYIILWESIGAVCVNGDDELRFDDFLLYILRILSEILSADRTFVPNSFVI